MEYWFQRIFLEYPRAFLATGLVTLGLSLSTPLLAEQPSQNKDEVYIDSEYFDVGLFTGVLNIEDFNSEYVIGGNITFNANEDFFMQFNYFQTDSSLSSYERVEGPYFNGSDRNFTHFDFLVGYNLFLGEQFFVDTKAKLSSLYLVAGVGDTEFGGEGSFTYTAGIGYQVALKRTWLMRIDYRDYIYETNIIGENSTVHNTSLTASLSYLF